MNCLFSAPYRFLSQATLDAYKEFMPTVFHEVWTLDEMEAFEGKECLTAWAPNPGQNFIIDTHVLESFPQLKIIATPSTGTNHIDTNACQEKGIQVYGLCDARPILDSISASAEFSFLLLLNSLRRLDRGAGEFREDRWREREDQLRGFELAGKRVGLVGYGRIGKRLARYCIAFDATVSYYDPYADAAELERTETLKQLFENSDIICICCSLTAETRGMIRAPLVRRLPTNAHLINTARGEILDESGLAEALDERPDLNVALDVLTGEVTNTHWQSPLKRFYQEGRIVITPHIAGATLESQNKAAAGALYLLQKHTPLPVNT